jgi:protein TonB
MTPERVVGIGFVVLLHVLAISAIVSGLGQKILRAVDPPPLILTLPRPDNPPPPIQVKPPKVELPTTSPIVTVPLPKFTIADDTPRITADPKSQQQPPPKEERVMIADTVASGVAGTHTIPPYPMTAVRLSEEGRVMLHLTISEEGRVASASVTQSSGFTDLDQSAIAWVLAHWKYKPAIRGGVAVASATDAAVVFSLKNAR